MAKGPRRPVGPEDAARDVERELAFHLEMRTREFEAQGLSPEEARKAAEASFGDVDDVAAACREERRLRERRWVMRGLARDLGADVRVAIRGLRRDPAFASAAILVLALGIALVVGMAGLIDAYLVRALPFPAADRLVHVQGEGAPDWLEVPDVIELPVSWDLDVLSIVGERPARAWTSWVAPTYFEAFGVEVALGRLPDAADLAPGAPKVAVISHSLWQRNWGGDPGVIGSTFTAYAQDRPEVADILTVIGVLPPNHWHLNRFYDVLSPIAEGRATYVARLARGVSLPEAEAVLRRHAEERGAESTEVRLLAVHETYVARIRPALLALGAAVALVLLIACGNAAVLLLVRASGREREFAVRSALGAGRTRIARQLVAEGLVLSSCAALLGIALGTLLLHATADVVPSVLGTQVPGGSGALRLDGAALAAAVGASTLAGLLFGLAPLTGVLRPGLSRGLAEGGRGGTGRSQSRMRDVLIGAELALSLALLVGAGLLLRSAAHLQQLPLGFSAENVTSLEVNIRQSRYETLESRAAFYDELMRTIETRVAGTDAELAFSPPFGWRVFGLGVPVETPAQPASDDETGPRALGNIVSPGYFDMLDITLRNGRLFEPGDRLGTLPVTVISASLAERVWPGRDPIGEQIRFSGQTMFAHEETWFTVIGVVDDVLKSLTDPNPSDLYYALAQFPTPGMQLLFETSAAGDPLDAVRRAVWSLDSEIPLDGVRYMEQDVRQASLPARFLAGVLAAFSIFAALLATFGLYGVVAYAVRRQRRDIAIRMALGSPAGGVVSLIVRRSLPVIGLGLVSGLGGAFWLAGLMRSQLHGVARLDPMTFLLGATLLVTAAVAATIVPALRAARAAPMHVLRTE
jgi:putative ABC transport system permease protein